MSNPVTKELIEKAYTYHTFREMTDTVYAKGRVACEGDSMSEYAQINVQRMMRLDKTVEIKSELKNEIAGISEKLIWLVIAEPWCGDVANNLPVIAKMAELNKNIDLRIVLRDKNPDLMNQYMTNGARAIPVLICFNASTMTELGKWGPRPAPAQNLAMELTSNPNITKEEKKKKIVLWYFDDKANTIQNEFLNLIKLWKK